MALPATLLLYLFYALLGLFTVFSLLNVFHLFRFGLVGYAGLFVTLAYVVVVALLTAEALEVANGYGWTEVFTFRSGPS